MFKSVQEIKDAVDAGKTVCQHNSCYKVIKDKLGRYLIKCLMNNFIIGLTHADGETLNGNLRDFYIETGRLPYEVSLLKQ